MSNKLESEIEKPKINDFTTITISRDNYNILKQMGQTGDSFNFVLSKILAKEVIK